jgi:ABC-2 type transport system ATP-binding protein
LYGMAASAARQRIPEVLELVGLSEHANRPIAGFSKGMLQRIGLAQAVLNEPELVFLDEPTSALDPFGRILVRTIIRQLRDRGTTVFLNSHLLGEVEATCDRAAFINNGVVLRSISMADLAGEKTEVRLQIDALSPALLSALQSLADGTVTQEPVRDGRIGLTLEISGDQQLPALATIIHNHEAQLYAMVPRRMSLEQLFLDVIGTQDSGQ